MFARLREANILAFHFPVVYSVVYGITKFKQCLDKHLNPEDEENADNFAEVAALLLQTHSLGFSHL